MSDTANAHSSVWVAFTGVTAVQPFTGVPTT